MESDFAYYLKNVLLELRNNSEEDISTIIKVLNHDEIDSANLEDFAGRQVAKLPSLEDVPERLHVMLFKLMKIKASWDNCLAFISGASFDGPALTYFLEQSEILAQLSSVAINDDEAALPLRSFLFNNNDIEDNTYRTYIQILPKRFKQFPDEIDLKKLHILVEENAVTYSLSAFDRLNEYLELQVLFTANNIDEYLTQEDHVEIDDDFREKLLRSKINDEQKLKIIEEMDLSLIATLPDRASLIGDLFYRSDTDISYLSAEAAQAVITNAELIDVQTALFNKSQSTLSNEEVRQTLQEMPYPFSNCKPGWEQPTIPKTKVNVELVKWLTERRIISSWKETFFGDIRVYNVRP